MPHREFVDSHGVAWEVWDVHPEAAERRRGGERRRALAPPHAGTELRAGVERRVSTGVPTSHRRLVSSANASGWLAFQSRHERRRLAPIPAGWESASDAELASMCGTAIGRPARRLLG